MCHCNAKCAVKLVQVSIASSESVQIKKTAHTMMTHILKQFRGNDLQSSTQKYKLPTSKIWNIYSLRLKVHHAKTLLKSCALEIKTQQRVKKASLLNSQQYKSQLVKYTKDKQ